MPPIGPALEYEFLAPQRIIFGWGRRKELGEISRDFGPRCFVVLGSRTLEKKGRWPELAVALTLAGIESRVVATISHEPEVFDVDQLVEALRQQNAGPNDWMLAIGGGSAIDLAKAAGAIVTQPGQASVQEYLEGVGTGLKLTAAPIPLVAMPTTGGTGTEATKNAVISSYDPPFKKSLRSNLMVPRLVLVDPELAVSVPPGTTAWTGMDAITQLIESYISRNARPIARAMAAEGLRRALPLLSEAVSNGASRPAREAMSHAALLSGMALANSGLGVAHGVAAALGSVCRVAHGLACAVMLPAALHVNRRACQAQLATLARQIWDRTYPGDGAAADALVGYIVGLCSELGIPRRLGEIGVRRDHLPALVAGSRGNSMNGNPVKLSDEELHRMLEAML